MNDWGGARIDPDWVLIGSRYQSKYVIFASRTLSYAELRSVSDDVDYWLADPYRFRPPVTQIELSASMNDFVYVTGDSYAEAFESLARTWSADRPQGDRQPADEIEGRRVLGS